MDDDFCASRRFDVFNFRNVVTDVVDDAHVH